MARTAASQSLTSKKTPGGSEKAFSAAYDSLFMPNDVAFLLKTFVGVTVQKINPIFFISIYCNENHIRLIQTSRGPEWFDVMYQNEVTGQTKNTARDPAWMEIGQSSSDKAKVPRPSPGKRGSYTTRGYVKEKGRVDTSNQAHIFISNERLNPPAGTDRDLRSYEDIVKNGLDDKHHKLEEIKPLAQTVLHELLHVAGGLQNPERSRLVIGDGPDKNTYGWRKCAERRANNQDNTNIADCLTMLAQALHLQIKGKETFWTTGQVDPKTLLAVNANP
ncbi:hypothetical protein GQ43DRAFT_472477 [Delitschia confertaspora ATCC 74209]|uniref:Uncharacterized protein n=1 Tax=Delitschia confertaspora ATCC 74209 TaxID=1513339 RepID=A0A9P4JJP8_9PLEO|nr:hypothetical protein GQ43DRAFT_472477 [Delitschia confertaspora ATCC 74209]